MMASETNDGELVQCYNKYVATLQKGDVEAIEKVQKGTPNCSRC